MINLDSITNENNKEHNEKWPFIPDHPYIILIIGGSGSGKTNALINLINEQHDIDKIITVLFFSSTRCQTNFNTLFDYENKQQKKITEYCN